MWVRACSSLVGPPVDPAGRFLFQARRGKKIAPTEAAAAILLPCRPAGERAGPSGPVVPGSSRATCNCYNWALGGDHLTHPPSRTHRLHPPPLPPPPPPTPRP